MPFYSHMLPNPVISLLLSLLPEGIVNLRRPAISEMRWTFKPVININNVCFRNDFELLKNYVLIFSLKCLIQTCNLCTVLGEVVSTFAVVPSIPMSFPSLVEFLPFSDVEALKEDNKWTHWKKNEGQNMIKKWLKNLPSLFRCWIGVSFVSVCSDWVGRHTTAREVEGICGGGISNLTLWATGSSESDSDSHSVGR